MPFYVVIALRIIDNSQKSEATWQNTSTILFSITYFRCFDKDSVEEIISALEADGSDWSKKQLQVNASIMLYRQAKQCFSFSPADSWQNGERNMTVDAWEIHFLLMVVPMGWLVVVPAAQPLKYCIGLSPAVVQSPTALKVTHRQLVLGAGLSFAECFKMEYRMSQAAMVRCILQYNIL